MAKRTNEEERDEMREEGDGSRVYELGFHIDPNLSSEEVKKTYQAVRSAIAGKGAIVAEAEPLLMRLAYTIRARVDAVGERSFDTAYFAWIVYETSATNHAEITSGVKSELRIIRFIDLVTTKEAARYSAELHEMMLKAREERLSSKATQEETEEAEAGLEEAPKEAEEA